MRVACSVVTLTFSFTTLEAKRFPGPLASEGTDSCTLLPVESVVAKKRGSSYPSLGSAPGR